MILPQLWEGEKSRLSDILKHRVLEYAGQPCETLLNKAYPLFFEARVIYFAKREIEKKNLLHLDRKNYTPDSDVEELYSSLLNAMACQRALSSEEISELVVKSVDLQVDCLVRPRQTLFERLYNNAEGLPKEDVLTVITAFDEARPFILHLVTELQAVETDTLPQVDFVSLATEAERHVYKEAPVSAFLTDVDLLLKFEETITGESQFVLRSDVLLGLLKERGLSAMAQSIEAEARGKEFWTPDEIENAMDRVILIGDFMDEPEEAEEVVSPAFPEDVDQREDAEGLDFRLPETISIEEIDFVKRVRARQDDDGDDSQMELNIRFADGNNDGEETDEASSPEAAVEEEGPVIRIAGAGEDDDEDSPSDSRDRAADIPSFATIISEDDREVLLEKLFRDDHEEYDKFVETLDGAADWKHAKHLIDQELDKRNVDPRSEEAVLLGDLAFARYYSDS